MSEVLDLARQLVAEASITPLDGSCQQLVAERLAAAGFKVELMPFGEVKNLWATHGEGSPVVCFAGHTDVVPPGPLEDWISAPFTPTERDGFLFGRGSADMKASDAAMTVALERIAAQPHKGTLALLLTSDEEGPGTDGTKRALNTLIERGEKIDFAIVGEPTSDQEFGDTIKSGRRGSMNGRLVVKGVQGHTAYPNLALNAVHRLVPALNALVGADWGHGNESFPPTTLQVSNFIAGTGAGNVIPGVAEVHFNIRFGTDWTVSALKARVFELLSSNGIEDSVVWQVSAEPFHTSDARLIQAFTESIKAETGVEPELSTGGGTSDARFFAAHGIPVAEFGPINKTIHAANEKVEIACLEPLARIYARIAQWLLSQ